MENESTIDSNQVQRLVDGELSADEIRTLFETADQNPEQWRGIACAFAEDQLFARPVSYTHLTLPTICSV